MEHNGLLYLAHHGQIFVGNRPVLQGVHNVEQGAHVIYHAPHVQREAPLRDRPAGDLLDHGLLVTGRIEGFHLEELHRRVETADGVLQRCDLCLVLALQGNDGPLRPQMGRYRCCGGHDPVGKRPAEIFVGLNQRLALRGVHQEALRLGRQFYMGGETGAAGSHHARGLDRFCQIHTRTIPFPGISWAGYSGMTLSSIS